MRVKKRIPFIVKRLFTTVNQTFVGNPHRVYDIVLTPANSNQSSKWLKNTTNLPVKMARVFGMQG